MSRCSRRDCLLLVAGAAAAARLPPSHAQAPEWPTGPSLDALARACGRRFGSAIGTRTLADPKYCEIIRRECGLIVAEDEHKWYVIRRKPGAFAFERADALMAFASEHRLGARGHTLLWHHPRWLPRWLSSHDYGAKPATEVERLVVEFIDRVCDRHGAQIHSWDVVNETVHEKTGLMRDTVFSRNMGSADAVVEVAFHAARNAAPKAELVYNDYMNWSAGSQAHRNGVLRFLERMLARNVPIDALGVQGHLGMVPLQNLQEREWRHFMDEVIGMGLAVLITEFDVHDREMPADIATRDQEMAARARAWLDLMLSYREVHTLMAWGMVDPHSWLQRREPRADGLPKRPTPYDENYRPKLLREAVAAALRSAPARVSAT